MKATVSFDGKKYIYHLDGKRIRTSVKSYSYEYVAVLTINGEFRDIMAMGNAKTCNAKVAEHNIIIGVLKGEIALLKGEITYSQYYNRVGFHHAFCKGYFKEMLAAKGDKFITEKEDYLAKKMTERIEVIKIEQA